MGVGFFLPPLGFVCEIAGLLYFVMAYTWHGSQCQACRHLLLLPFNTTLHLISSTSKGFWQNNHFPPADFFHIALRAT